MDLGKVQERSRGRSVVLNMVEVLGVGEGGEELDPVFNVGLNIGDFGIENISQSVLAEEDVTDHSHTLRILVLRPDLAETHHSGEDGLQLRQFLSDPLVRRRRFLADAAEQSFILLNVGDDGLPVVFGDVLGLVAGDPIGLDPALQREEVLWGLDFNRFLLIGRLQCSALKGDGRTVLALNETRPQRRLHPKKCTFLLSVEEESWRRGEGWQDPSFDLSERDDVCGWGSLQGRGGQRLSCLGSADLWTCQSSAAQTLTSAIASPQLFNIIPMKSHVLIQIQPTPTLFPPPNPHYLSAYQKLLSPIFYGARIQRQSIFSVINKLLKDGNNNTDSFSRSWRQRLQPMSTPPLPNPQQLILPGRTSTKISPCIYQTMYERRSSTTVEKALQEGQSINSILQHHGLIWTPWQASPSSSASALFPTDWRSSRRILQSPCSPWSG